MRNQVVQVIVLCLCLSFPNLLKAENNKISVYSSSVVKRSNGNLRQIGVIEISDRSIKEIDVELIFPDQTMMHHYSDLEASYHTVSFEFPVLKELTMVQVRIAQLGTIIYEDAVQFRPPKEWKIYDVQVSHHDLGYADYYHMMRRDIREMGIEMAMEFARKTDSWPEESQFHWTVETSEPLIQYLSRQSEEVLSELFERIENGQIALGGIHNSVSTEHLGYEAMARQFYTPNRYVCDWFNTEPSKTALNTDVVGFSRALAMYSKEADMPYFMFGRNSTVKAFDKAEDDAAFYWRSPDMDSKMSLFKVWHYYSPDRLIKYDLAEIAKLCKRYESHKNYPYSCILAEDSYDFGLPEIENVEGIRNWNQEYANPVLVSGTFDMYFDDLSSQQDKESFKIFDKDAPNAWADQDLTDAEYANKARRLNSSLPSVEKWATIASAVTAGSFPWIDIYQSYYALLMWGEHTNGAYSEGPIFQPPSLDDPDAANATYYELEQEMHRDLIRESEFFKEKAEEVAIQQLESQITTNSRNTLVVNNPLVRKRTDYVTFEIPEGKSVRKIIDNMSGKEVQFQYSDKQNVFFYAEEVPSLGYKTYSLEFDKREVEQEFESVESPKIDNEYYSLEFDPKSGGIKSLYDKMLKRELVDQDARFKLNEYYYERFESSSYQEGTMKYQAESASFEVYSGPIADVVVAKVEAEGAKDIVQTVRVYKNSNRIDFEVGFDKDDSGRTLEDYRNYSPEGKEGLFYCLPFDVPNFTIQHELAGGVMEPIEDQFKGSSTDFYAIQNFSDISNDDWGITLATVEPNLVEYGKPRSAYWSKGDDYENIMEKAEDSHFYLYILNNMFFTNVRQTQPGAKNFRWSVRSHDGNWQEGKAYLFGRDVANPLIAFISNGKKKGILPSKSKSFVELDSEDILCSTIKPAELNGEGYILRFVEVGGREQIVNVDINFVDGIEGANFTNLVELDRDYELEVTGRNSFKFEIPAFGLRTIRITPSKIMLPQIVNLKGVAKSDSKIELSWNVEGKDSDKIAYYRVFRSTSPNFEPSLRTFVNNTDTKHFIDASHLNFRGWQSNVLDPETQYYYKVQAVGINNRAGTSSSEISVKSRSAGEVDERPNKVLGLNSTLISHITDHSYVGLYFYTNIEEDINSYVIYRSEEEGKAATEEDIIAEMDVSQVIEHVTPHGFGKVSRALKAYNRQIYIDEDIQPFTCYYYKVAAKDDAGQIGPCSEEVSITSTVGVLRITGDSGFRDRAVISIINPNNNDWEIRYTSDESLPTKNSSLYKEPIEISEDIILTASLFRPGSEEGIGTIQRDFRRVNDYDVSYRTKYNDKWKSSGDIALIDNYRGDVTLGSRWQGFEVNDMEVVIDMKGIKEIGTVSVGCLQNVGSWVYFPNYIEVFTSKDGENFELAGRVETVKEWQRLISKKADMSVSFPKTACRYVKVFAKNIAYNPVWHNFSGGKAWLFVDEIIIE